MAELVVDSHASLEVGSAKPAKLNITRSKFADQETNLRSPAGCVKLSWLIDDRSVVTVAVVERFSYFASPITVSALLLL